MSDAGSLQVDAVVPRLGGRAAPIVIAALLCLTPAVAAADNADIFTPIGSIAEQQNVHFLRIALISLIAIIPALIAAPLVIWLGRIGNKTATYSPDWSFNRWYELAIWTAPVVIVVVLSYWLFDATRKLDPYKPLAGEQLRIDLVGLDWKWLAIYPDHGVAAVDTIVVPVDRPVAFRLTADTVMQSFLPNGLAGQIYLMPGMVTQLHLSATEAGEGTAIQTQYSGTGFTNQRVPMRALSANAFDAWLASASGDPLDAETYPTLAVSGVSAREAEGVREMVRPLTDPCLFDRVVARYHQGTAIPPEAQPGSPSYRAEAGALPAGDCADLAQGTMGHHMHGASPQTREQTGPTETDR